MKSPEEQKELLHLISKQLENMEKEGLILNFILHVEAEVDDKEIASAEMISGNSDQEFALRTIARLMAFHELTIDEVLAEHIVTKLTT